MSEALQVFLHGQQVGVVTRSRTGFGRIVFAVDDGYVGEPDALTEGFALTPGVTIDSTDSTNFFGGYAPEGLHRTSLATTARIDEKDLFGFLKRYGLTMAGALSFHGPDDRPNEPARYRDLSVGELVRKLDKAQHESRRFSARSATAATLSCGCRSSFTAFSLETMTRTRRTCLSSTISTGRESLTSTTPYQYSRSAMRHP
nr:HipA N-terminal domain-containing protein [Cryobacterium sp. Y11]